MGENYPSKHVQSKIWNYCLYAICIFTLLISSSFVTTNTAGHIVQEIII